MVKINHHDPKLGTRNQKLNYGILPIMKANKKPRHGEETTKRDFPQNCPVEKPCDVFDWKTQILLPVSVAFVSALIGGAFPFLSQYCISHSDLSKECGELKTQLRVCQSVLEDKVERIDEQRARIESLEGRLLARESQLNAKADFCELLKIKYYEKSGIAITNDAALARLMAQGETSGNQQSAAEPPTRMLITGPVAKRLGLTDDMTMREKIVKGWRTPLLVDNLPGVFLPAADDILDGYLGFLDALAANDLEKATASAQKAQARLAPILEPFLCRGAQIDVRLGIVAASVYQSVAEDALSRGDLARAAYLMGVAAGVLGEKPPPHLLAMESAVVQRLSEGRIGYFTRHIADAIAAAKDENYTYQIHEELAKLGYLQLFLPNKEGTDIGERIDWNKFGKGRVVHTRPTFVRDGAVWSTRWIGKGRYEEYNLSATFKRTLGAVGMKQQ